LCFLVPGSTLKWYQPIVLLKRFRKLKVTIQAAIIGAIIAGVFLVVAPFIRESFQDSSLQLVSVEFLEDKSDLGQGSSETFPGLDIKIRNIGTKVAFIHRADLIVERVWQLQPESVFVAHQFSSHTYQVTLPLEGAPYTIPVSISQTVPSSERDNPDDRFTLELGNEEAVEADYEYVFLLTLKLIYDEDDKSLVSNNLLFSTQLYGSSYQPSFIDENSIVFVPPEQVEEHNERLKRGVRKNQQVAAEIEKIEGNKSARLKEVLKILSEIRLQ